MENKPSNGATRIEHTPRPEKEQEPSHKLKQPKKKQIVITVTENSDEETSDEGKGDSEAQVEGGNETDEDVDEEEEEPKKVVKKGPETHYVKILDGAFSPSDLTIRKGDTVVWTHEDIINKNHFVTAMGNKFKGSPMLFYEQTYGYTFEQEGEYKYIDPLYSSKAGVKYEEKINDTINTELNTSTNETYLVKVETTEAVKMEGKITVT